MNDWIVSNPNFESDLKNPMLVVSPWAGHRNFAYDLINYIRPNSIVELGTHYGCSFFSFCQSIKNNGLHTHVTAIDTWEGDSQAGYYDNGVYELVQTIIQSHYSTVSLTLKRGLFQEVVKEFEDDSVDVIHIDGLHTYEAVSEDFSTWLPKLKPDGVMLFHDTAGYTGYGSHDFWEELKQEYPHYEFTHSWGLGVLFPKGEYWYQKLLKQNIGEKISLYTYKAEYELAQIKVADLTLMATERHNAINNMEKMIVERDEVISAQKQLIEMRYEIIAEMDQMIKDRDKVIQGQKKLVEERYKAIVKMEGMIKERDQVITELKSEIEELRIEAEQKNDIIVGQQRLVEERYEAILQMDQMIKERDDTISNMEEFVKMNQSQWKKWLKKFV